MNGFETNEKEMCRNEQFFSKFEAYTKKIQEFERDF